GLNNTTDTNPSYEDMAFGGAGRDVLISNTGGDRLIDWIGEFNSFLTPYAPFGMASVSRTLQPQLPEYLYALSASDGADPTLAARYLSDAARNGEPYGELGLLRQTDAAIADNRGKPRDPQAGNLPGGKRDVLRTSGSQPINSPGTCCVPPVAASRLVSAPTRVDNNGQTAVPTVVSGPAGSVVNYTVSDGTTTVSGTGTIGADGMLPVVLDLSGLSDSVLTTTVTPVGAASLSTTLIKSTAPPAAPGLSLPKYVYLGNRSAVPIAVAGEAGATATVSVTDGTTTVTGNGTVGTGGTATISLDLSLLKEGIVTATGYLTDQAGNQGARGLAANATKNTIAPSGTFTITGTVIGGQLMTKNPTLSLQLVFNDGAGLTQMAFSTNGGTSYGTAVSYASTASTTLSGDGLYTIAARVTDVPGNSTVVTQTIRLVTVGPTISYTMAAPTNSGPYDVGLTVPATVNFGATSVANVASLTATLDNTISLSNGQAIDMDTLNAGAHTIVITAKDQLGNTSTTTTTFQVHATAAG